MFFMPAGRYACGGVSGVKPEGGGKPRTACPEAPGCAVCGPDVHSGRQSAGMPGEFPAEAGQGCKARGLWQGVPGDFIFSGKKNTREGNGHQGLLRKFCGRREC